MAAQDRQKRIVVVGAGVFGAWTAHHLLNAGHCVTLIEAHSPAHPLASSSGESRLTRAAYGRDAIYTRMAIDSLPQWQAVSATAGAPLFIPTGILFFFQSEEPYFRDTVAAHRDVGLPTQVLDRSEMARRFPAIDFEGVEVGVFEPGFGVLLAQRSVQTLVEQFVRAGGAYVEGSVRLPNAVAGRLDRVEIDPGEDISADYFVFACGPWLPKLFPDVIGARIRPTRQEIFYFAAPDGDPRFLPQALPGWADFNHGDMYYGMPDIEGRGVKFAHDLHGVPVDPDTQDRRPTQAAIDAIVAFRDRRFPALRGAALSGAEVCQYENSSNGDFLIDVHPRLENVLLVGGGSGHGFKHGPEVGRYAAARLFGLIDPEPRFSLSTKAEAHQREVH